MPWPGPGDSGRGRRHGGTASALALWLDVLPAGFFCNWSYYVINLIIWSKLFRYLLSFIYVFVMFIDISMYCWQMCPFIYRCLSNIHFQMFPGNYVNLNLATAKPEFGQCQTRVWQLPNPKLAAANPEFGHCQTKVWQLPNPSLAAKPEVGSCRTRVWPLPNQSLAAAKAKPELGRQARAWQPNPSLAAAELRFDSKYVFNIIIWTKNMYLFDVI